ncbi:SDR family oxidoreductase [Alkalicoccobacillus porphyridii]|uniref:SDR family oxidoreductase n=1 Tax=Alkalicoccobacillus porphyridii TaxID=2597270 RepID=A0A554A047_9BACI|nr:SDR family NAD(P)-dependent oxidoreductase [Alkalicoccobacillus porphyridii]TSB47074.1 SDR family oxidoreductase [Alkalicoccobacillus porphyridii]
MSQSENVSIAVVTGAGSGIGKSTAIQLATKHFNVAVFDIEKERALETVQEIEDSGGKAAAFKVDVQNENEIKQAFKQVSEMWSDATIRAVFANAGVNGVFSAIEYMDVEDWDQTININLRGTFLTTKHAVPYLKNGGGSIVITSSINGNRKYIGTGMSAYSASKAAQVAFMKMAAVELGRYNIRVNAICPGAIETNIGENTHPKENLEEIRIKVEYPEGVPFGGQGKPEQVADVVSFLLTDQSSHVSGMEMYVDGAQSLV